VAGGDDPDPAVAVCHDHVLSRRRERLHYLEGLLDARCAIHRKERVQGVRPFQHGPAHRDHAIVVVDDGPAVCGEQGIG
jgi:hypothetical protein